MEHTITQVTRVTQITQAAAQTQPKPPRQKQDKATYRAKQQAAKKQAYAARRAAGICVRCGGPIVMRRGATLTQCCRCADEARKRGAAFQQRKRNKAMGYTPGDGRNVKRWPMGAASTGKRDGGEFDFTLIFDRESLEAIQVIRKRYRDGEWKAGREPQTHQLSRLVRDIILKYEPNRAVVTPRKHRLRVEAVAYLSLDGRTKAILERQAALSFNGNKSATLRAMLIECQGARRAWTGSGSPQSVPVVFI